MSSARFALIGYPVTHSQSPRIHREFGQQFGLDVHYGLIAATETQFSRVTRNFFINGGQGLNVTIPHKQKAALWVDECSQYATRAGAVNTIGINADGTSWGDNTDGVGLIRDLTQNHNIDLLRKKILIVGAGGAARGVMAALMAEKPDTLSIVNRTVERAMTLADILSDGDCGISVLDFADTADQTWDLIINATSAGLNGLAPHLPESAITPSTVVYDCQYGKAAQPFTDWAAKLGAGKTLSGWGMLVEQAAVAFELWHGLTPDTSSLLSGEWT